MIIPINIVREYPVDWNFQQILRDLVQNFYDEIGYENFSKEFQYEWEEKEGYINLSMKTKGHSFCYEWLTYVGGSTKTGSDRPYIGMYGEGFKICMLCLLRDFGLVPRMSSQDWSIIPCWEIRKIGESSQNTLAYDLSKRKDNGETTLTIEGIPLEYLDDIKCGMMDFYYPENPLIGRLLCRSDDYIIHERSDKQIPCAQWDGNLKGIYYQSFLARGRLPFPLVIVNLKEIILCEKSRKRRTFYPFEVNKQVYHLTIRMQPKESYQMLMQMKDFWNDLPKEKEDIYTWYYVINQLVRNVSRSKVYSGLFLKENPNLVCVERNVGDKRKNGSVESAQRWARERGDKRRKVNPIFRLLKVPSLVEEYKMSGMGIYREPAGVEIRRVHILQSVVKTVMKDVLNTDNLADIILLRENENYPGALTFAERCYGKKKHNGCRVSYKYKITKAVVEERYLSEECFEEALLRYMDILCHCFGTDRNANVNGMLTECGGILIRFRKMIQDAKKEWVRS